MLETFPGLAVRPGDGLDGPGSLGLVLDGYQVEAVQLGNGTLDRAVAVVGDGPDSVIRGSAAIPFAPGDEVEDVQLS